MRPATARRNITVSDGKAFIELTRGYTTVVDEASLPIRFTMNVKGAHVCMTVAATPWRHFKDRSGNVYATYTKTWRESGRRMFCRVWLHKVVMGAVDTEVDHRDRNSLNNLLENLRTCSRTQNARNRRAAVGASGFRGVLYLPHQSKRRPWQARIRVTEGGKRREIWIGTFETKEEAAIAYDAAVRREYGEFAVTNFSLSGERNATS